MFKVTRKMKRSFNLSSEPDIFLYRLIQQVRKCHPGGPPPLAMLLPPQPPKKKTPKKSTTKTKTLPPIGASDHDIVYSEINLALPQNKQQAHKVLNYKKAQWDQIEKDLTETYK